MKPMVSDNIQRHKGILGFGSAHILRLADMVQMKWASFGAGRSTKPPGFQEEIDETSQARHANYGNDGDVVELPYVERLRFAGPKHRDISHFSASLRSRASGRAKHRRDDTR